MQPPYTVDTHAYLLYGIVNWIRQYVIEDNINMVYTYKLRLDNKRETLQLIFKSVRQLGNSRRQSVGG